MFVDILSNSLATSGDHSLNYNENLISLHLKCNHRDVMFRNLIVHLLMYTVILLNMFHIYNFLIGYSEFVLLFSLHCVTILSTHGETKINRVAVAFIGRRISYVCNSGTILIA